MSEDFFGDLGKSITKVTRRAMGRTGSLIESTRLGGQIGTEEKNLERLYSELGQLAYERCTDGRITPDAVMRPVIEEMTVSLGRIRGYRSELAEVRGQKVCVSCGTLISPDMLFCPKCGAAAPPEEKRAEEKEQLFPDDDDGDIVLFGSADETEEEYEEESELEFVVLEDDEAPFEEDET